MRATAYLLLFLVLVGGSFAANVTVSLPGNVTIVCNNASQCAGTAPGTLPFFFTAIDTNTTIPVVLSGTYEQNITIVQNVTVNLTNHTVEVITQNITVVSCNESPNTEAISNAVSNNIAAQLQTSLVTTCANACKPSEEERLGLQNQKADAERQWRECSFQLEAQLNSSRKDYEYLNATLSQEVEDLESQQILTYVIFFIGMFFLVLCAVYVFKKSTIDDYLKGRTKRQTPGHGPEVR
jgi:hypothetical protein